MATRTLSARPREQRHTTRGRRETALLVFAPEALTELEKHLNSVEIEALALQCIQMRQVPAELSSSASVEKARDQLADIEKAALKLLRQLSQLRREEAAAVQAALPGAPVMSVDIAAAQALPALPPGLAGALVPAVMSADQLAALVAHVPGRFDGPLFPTCAVLADLAEAAGVVRALRASQARSKAKQPGGRPAITAQRLGFVAKIGKTVSKALGGRLTSTPDGPFVSIVSACFDAVPFPGGIDAPVRKYVRGLKHGETFQAEMQSVQVWPGATTVAPGWRGRNFRI